MASVFSSKQEIYSLVLLLPLNVPFLLIPNTSVAIHNNTCDCFKQGEHLKKLMSQNNVLDLLQDKGSCEVNDNIFCTEKFSSMLSRHGMKNFIVKSRSSQVSVHFYTITLCACEFL